MGSWGLPLPKFVLYTIPLQFFCRYEVGWFVPEGGRVVLYRMPRWHTTEDRFEFRLFAVGLKSFVVDVHFI